MTSPSKCIPAHANEIPAQKRGLTGAPYTTIVPFVYEKSRANLRKKEPLVGD